VHLLAIVKHLYQDARCNDKDFIVTFLVVRGHAVAQLIEGTAGSGFPMVSLEFFIDIILPAALWP